MFLAPPKTKKALIADSEEPWEIYWCVWKGDLAERPQLKLSSYDNMNIYHISDNIEFSGLFNFLIYNEHQESKVDVMVKNFTELLIADFKPSKDSTGFVNKHSETINEIKNFIDKNYQTTNIEEISRAFHFDRKYLSYIFREVVGMTMQDYLQKAKLRCAETLLLYDNISIEKISALSGYANYSSFIKAFKKEYQLTPSQFIRLNKI